MFSGALFRRVTAEDGALGDQWLRTFSGRRENDPDDPYHVAEAFDRRRCTQRPQHRLAATGWDHDRVHIAPNGGM
jgi:hypothetical protein